MDSELALSILLQNIKSRNELSKPENRWILHSIYVGLAARRIAHKLNLDEDFALTIGYMHDIGRIIDHSNHPIAGFQYLNNLGFPNIARYSLTHSFINNIIPNTIGKGPDKESFVFISNYLNTIELNIYDNIIQLCDLFCLESGFTTFEKRILDITERKGLYPNSSNHFKSIMTLKDKIESMMNCKLYDLFPEISKNDLDNQVGDKEKLLSMFNKIKVIK